MIFTVLQCFVTDSSAQLHACLVLTVLGCCTIFSLAVHCLAPPMCSLLAACQVHPSLEVLSLQALLDAAYDKIRQLEKALLAKCKDVDAQNEVCTWGCGNSTRN